MGPLVKDVLSNFHEISFLVRYFHSVDQGALYSQARLCKFEGSSIAHGWKMVEIKVVLLQKYHMTFRYF